MFPNIHQYNHMKSVIIPFIQNFNFRHPFNKLRKINVLLFNVSTTLKKKPIVMFEVST